MAGNLVIALLIIFYILSKLAYRRNHTTKYGAPFVPLEPDVISRVLDLVDIKKGDVFYDLGSGDGRLVIAAALKGARAYGIEIDPIRAFYSRLWIFLFRLNNQATIIQKNIFDVNLSDADVITLYLPQETNDKLKPKLEKEAKLGVRIVSVAFNLPGWHPAAVDPRGPIYGPLYLYKPTLSKPAN